MTAIETRARDLPEGDALARAWRELEARAEPGFFLTWDWIGAWLMASGLRPRLLEARAQGRLVGLALWQPARQRRHGLFVSRRLLLHEAGEPAIDAAAIEYNGVLAERGRESAVLRAMLEHLVAGADPALPAWDELRFGGVPAAYGSALADTGLDVHVASRSRATVVDLAALRAGGRSFLASLSANSRQQIRRAIRHYEATGPLTIAAARDRDEALGQFAELAALHEATWRRRGKAGAFARPFVGTMHRQLIAESFASGAVELLRIAAGQQTVGYLYNFLHRGWVGAYMSGFRYQDDAKAKPGLVSYALAIERHAALGNRVFDFLAGESRYKASLGGPGAELVWFDLQHPRLAFRIERGLRRLRRI
ncbi:MAG: GNAT family N-acetyltransferase [Alphaproteobacteria bacterium]|nr:GNAT family N-acetyltransferase [Alphaproteobacteria bacterium]